MVEDKLISKNKLLMYLADLELTYAPVYGKGEAEKYNFIKELSRIFEQWDGETVSKTESVECEDCILRESACQKMMEMYKADCEMYGVEIPECFDGHRAVRALMELPSVTPKQSEIIHCCDCKKYHKLECPFGIGFGTPSRNDYCYQAKRITDD